MSDGLTTRERIDKEFDEIDTLLSVADETAPQGEPEPAAAIEVTPEPVAPAPDPQLEAIKEEARKTQARYDSLQGMINKQNRELEELRAKVVTPPPPLIKVDEPTVDADYALLVEEYGEPAAKAMKSMSGKVLETAKKELDEVRAELNQTKEVTGQLVNANALTAEQRYYSELDKAVPEWRSLNGEGDKPQSPEFTKLLTQTVPFQDYTYNDLLQYHHERGNVAKVAEIFKAVQVGQPVIPPAPKADPLEQMLEPDRTQKGTAPPATETKKTFTKAEVAKFDNDYMLYQSGRLQADPVKIEARWNEIQDAYADGRVR